MPLTAHEKRIQTIQRVSWIGIIGNGLLAMMKVVVGFMSSSLAVLADGIDSTTDIITSLVSLFAARIMRRPPDKNHPYGHGRSETLATKIISFIVFFTGAQLMLQAVDRMIHRSFVPLSTAAIVVTAVSIVVKLGLAGIKFSAGKRINSELLIADAKNMRNDVVLSSCVLVSLLFSHFSGCVWIDPVAALIISLWTIIISLKVYRKTDNELMEGYDNFKDYETIFTAIDSVEGAYNPHKVRIRRLGEMLIVDLDVEVEGNATVYQGHEIAKKVESAVKGAIPNVYDVLVHVEPRGNSEDDEKYGVTVDEISK